MAIPIEPACTKCDGRGFHRPSSRLIGHNGQELAYIYERADMCVTCFGTGKNTGPVISLKSVLIGFLVSAPLVFGGLYFLLNL